MKTVPSPGSTVPLPRAMEDTSDSIPGAVVAMAVVTNSTEHLDKFTEADKDTLFSYNSTGHFDNLTEALNDAPFSCCRGDLEACRAKFEFYSLFLPVSVLLHLYDIFVIRGLIPLLTRCDKCVW